MNQPFLKLSSGIKVKINPEILNEVVQPYDVPILVHSPYYAIIVLASTDCGDSF